MHLGTKQGSLSSIHFHIGDETFANESLRTSLRPWQMQKWLKKMKKAECQYVVIEISSHAIDQQRHWGIGVDTAVLTNIFENEHLDYHKNV
jgi:UDP-N-acetylmuramoyl-L-alanyl-D-glutamate--2,6-diaminopimelate ligase